MQLKCEIIQTTKVKSCPNITLGGVTWRWMWSQYMEWGWLEIIWMSFGGAWAHLSDACRVPKRSAFQFKWPHGCELVRSTSLIVWLGIKMLACISIQKWSKSLPKCMQGSSELSNACSRAKLTCTLNFRWAIGCVLVFFSWLVGFDWKDASARNSS